MGTELEASLKDDLRQGGLGSIVTLDPYGILFVDYYKILSRIVRKPNFFLGENKGADQLRGNREADQRLCFRYTDSTISLLLKSEISSF